MAPLASPEASRFETSGNGTPAGRGRWRSCRPQGQQSVPGPHRETVWIKIFLRQARNDQNFRKLRFFLKLEHTDQTLILRKSL